MASGERAEAHAAFEGSSPAMNEVVPTPPSEARIRFTEPLETSYTRAELYDRSGATVDDTAFRIDDADRHTLILSLPGGLANGTYTVAWQTLSAADGHTLQGFFAFTIGTAADVGAAAGVSLDGSGAPDWLQTVSRWVALLGLAAAVAIWPMWLLVLRPSLAPMPDLAERIGRRLQRLATIVVPAAILGSVFALLVQAAANAGDAGFLDSLWSTLTDTRYGDFWLLRVALFAVLGLALMTSMWSGNTPRIVPSVAALTALIALPLPFSMLSHASAQQEHHTTAVAADYVHLLGASVWAGGLFVLAVALLPALRRAPEGVGGAVLASVVPRFSVLALAAWVTLGLTGVYAAYLHVGSLDALWNTTYGESLIVKLLILTPALLLAAVNLLVYSPRLRRAVNDASADKGWAGRFSWTVGAEAVLVVAALLVVGRLIGTPPAREDLAAQQPEGTTIEISLVTQDEVRPSSLAVSPSAPGPNDYRFDVGGSPLPDGTEGVLRMETEEVAIGQKEVKLARTAGTNTFTGSGSELAIAAEWAVEVIVRKPGTLEGRATVQLPVGDAATGSTADEMWHIDWPGLVGLAFVVVGAAGLAGAWLFRTATWRNRGALGGGLGVAVGALLIYGALIAPDEAVGGGSIAGVGTPVASGGLEVMVTSDFGAIGDAALTIDVRDESGAPIEDATVSIDGEMPEMGMTLIPLAAERIGAGQYVVRAVPITMSGEWEVMVTVERPGEQAVTMPFRLEVEA